MSSVILAKFIKEAHTTVIADRLIFLQLDLSVQWWRHRRCGSKVIYAKRGVLFVGQMFHNLEKNAFLVRA
jgi:hypothetical protein